jgi:hypothetical protein
MKTIASILGISAMAALAADPALTIYNQNIAVVRDTVSLDLKSGVNDVRFPNATAQVEPDSVILRDPTGRRNLQVLEQNYRNDPVSQGLLLSMFEGKTIQFEVMRTKDNTTVRDLVSGKIIRSGYVPYQSPIPYHAPDGPSPDLSQPIIEVDGKLRFSLPGLPLFPNLGDDTILKPTLHWQVRSDTAGKFDAEVAYITGGFTWEADYNLVAPEKGDIVDLIGWVTMNNQSGKSFQNAKIKLMAGDVQKLQQQQEVYSKLRSTMADFAGEPAVTEKAFDEFHLYTVARPTALLDRQTKQVEFVRATGVKAPTVYVYDGAKTDLYRGWNHEMIRNNREYGTQSNPKVWIMREISNSETNKLGMPLPKGRLRFYRSNDDRQLEFTGEDMIDHTARNELIRVFTGNAFDLVGERTRMNYRADSGDKWADESFEIKVRNRKKESVEIRVVEHLYRWNNWEITQKSNDFTKTDAQTIEFRVKVNPDEEKIITYTVHYSW